MNIDEQVLSIIKNNDKNLSAKEIQKILKNQMVSQLEISESISRLRRKGKIYICDDIEFLEWWDS